MAKYKRPVQHVTEEPRVFIKHWWHVALDWAKAKRDTLVTVLLVLVIIGLGGVMWRNYAEKRGREAWQATGGMSSVPELEAASFKYAGTAAEPFIKLSLGDRYVLTGEASKAAGVYRQVAEAEAAEKDIAERAKLTLAYAYEEADRFEDARTVFEGLAESEGFWGEKARAALEEQPAREAAARRLASLREEASAASAQETAAAEAASVEGENEPAAETTMEASQAEEASAAAESIAAETEEDNAESGNQSE